MKATKLDLDQTMSDLLCSAFEGGSNYWYMIEKFEYPEGKTRSDFQFPHLEVPFKGGALKITADGEKKVYTLDRRALDKGWKLMISDQPRHYADAVTGGGDATTGDVFLQLCLFGKVIFG
jgi:hypothetical protein